MENIKKILLEYRQGKINEDEVINLLKLDYIERIDNYIQFDLFRKERKGIPEIVYAESKSEKMVIELIEKVLSKCNSIIISRLRKEHIEEIQKYILRRQDLSYELNDHAFIMKIYKKDHQKIEKKGYVGIIAAGTSDIRVAEESRMVVEEMGVNTITAYDVGIAGFHRIFEPLKVMLEKKVSVIIVVAGMEGTLPGIVASLVDVPVIGVPTSVGYGFGSNGIGALTTMLQSCSLGLLVVNIDNGVGAGASAALIALKQIS